MNFAQLLEPIFGSEFAPCNSVLETANLIGSYYSLKRKPEMYKHLYEMLGFLYQTNDLETIKFRIKEERRLKKAKSKTFESSEFISCSHPTGVHAGNRNLRVNCHFQLPLDKNVEIKHDNFDLTISQTSKEITTLQLNANYTRDGSINDFLHFMLQGRLDYDVLRLFEHDSAKEISESMSAMHWVAQQFKDDMSDTLILCVGDGRTPRTAALFGRIYKKSTVYSIDPESKTEYKEEWKNKFNCYAFAQKVEDFLSEHFDQIFRSHPFKRVILVAVHSHAPLESYVPQICQKLTNKHQLLLVAIPCCVQQQLGQRILKICHLNTLPTIIDWNIHSAKRKVVRLVRNC